MPSGSTWGRRGTRRCIGATCCGATPATLWSDAGHTVTLSGLGGESVTTINTIPEAAADGTTALDGDGNARHEVKSHPVVDGAVTLQLGEDPLILEL